MEIKLNFNNTEIDTRVIKFFEANLINEEDKTSLQRIDKGNKLFYMDANSLFQAILKSITISGDFEAPSEAGKKQ